MTESDLILRRCPCRWSKSSDRLPSLSDQDPVGSRHLQSRYVTAIKSRSCLPAPWGGESRGWGIRQDPPLVYNTRQPLSQQTFPASMVGNLIHNPLNTRVTYRADRYLDALTRLRKSSGDCEGLAFVQCFRSIEWGESMQFPDAVVI